jgi:hypothetical protein
MPTKSYSKRTEQNIVDSSGTLIISHGKLTGGSKLTKELADKHQRPCLHIDLNQTAEFQAAERIREWIQANRIEVLNVAGPRAPKDPKIYKAVMDILETFWYMAIADDSYAVVRGKTEPKTVSEAVDMMVANMPLKDKTVLASMDEADLFQLHFSMGVFIRNQFGLWSGNEELLNDCRKVSGEASLHPDDAASMIIKELWKRLRETHKLRVVK